MRILIELPTWLGDTVMMTPAFENLVNNYENPNITILGSAISVEVLKNHSKVNKALILNKKYINLYKNARALKKFDAFFSFRGSFRSRVLKFFISSKKKYQYDHKKFQNQHQVIKYNSFINECLNLNLSAGRLFSDKKLKSNKADTKLIVGINPGASYGSSKRWYPDEFAKVAFELSNKFNIIIFGGPNERNFANDIEKILIKKGILNYQNLAGKTSVTELIEKISNLDLFITGDSGPMHIAASYEIPTVSIFGSTKDNETSQWMNTKSVIVKKKLDCQPCMKRNCPLIHHNCMKLIKSKEVIEAARLII